MSFDPRREMNRFHPLVELKAAQPRVRVSGLEGSALNRFGWQVEHTMRCQ